MRHSKMLTTFCFECIIKKDHTMTKFVKGVDYSVFMLMACGVVFLHNEAVIAHVKDMGFKKVRTMCGKTFCLSLFAREV